MAVVRFYSNEAVNGRALQRAAKLYHQLSITTELCYNVELTGECVTANNLRLWASKQLIQLIDTFKLYLEVSSCCLSLFHVFHLCKAFLLALCCRLWESQCRAEGGSPLVVSSSPAGGPPVGETKSHRGQRGETGGDRTEVVLYPSSLISYLDYMLWVCFCPTVSFIFIILKTL